MKKKIYILIFCYMLVISTLSMNVFAGDQSNPEIVDMENDIIGTLIKHPILFNILQKIGILPIESFDFMDINSAWFYEDESDPDYLFASVMIKNLDYTPLRAIYSIRWTYNEKNYAAACHTHSDGEFSWFSAGGVYGIFDNWAYNKGLIQDITDCKIDLEENVINFKIPKDLVGDPKPGDVLTYTNAWTGLRFICEILTYPLGGEMASDPTSYGKDYIVQY